MDDAARPLPDPGAASFACGMGLDSVVMIGHFGAEQTIADEGWFDGDDDPAINSQADSQCHLSTSAKLNG